MNALASTIDNAHSLSKCIPQDHTIMAEVYNQLILLYATKNILEEALHSFFLSLNIYS